MEKKGKKGGNSSNIIDFMLLSNFYLWALGYRNEDKDTRPLFVSLLNIATYFLARLVASTSFKGQASTIFSPSVLSVCFGGIHTRVKHETVYVEKLKVSLYAWRKVKAQKSPENDKHWNIKLFISPRKTIFLTWKTFQRGQTLRYSQMFSF